MNLGLQPCKQLLAPVSFAVLFCAVCLAEDAALPGRPVRVVSLSFPMGQAVQRIAPLVEAEASKGCDLIVLPETWRGQKASEDTADGPTLPVFMDIARRHRTYIVCPLDRMDGDTRYNTAFVIDRSGALAGAYDKVYPYWSEFDYAPPVTPGTGTLVVDTDFGKLGLAICFDANFPGLWQELADQGAEIVVWPSAYSAGNQLQAHALNHHYYIVTSTLINECLVFDITGKRLLEEKTDGINISRITLDLDRGIYHQNFNMDGRKKLLREHKNEVAEDIWLEQEQWFVLKALKAGISARALAKDYGLEELRDYKRRSREAIDAKRTATP